jgi:hypothetical protein
MATCASTPGSIPAGGPCDLAPGGQHRAPGLAGVPTARVARLAGVLLLAAAATACGGRRPPLPDIAGPLPDVVVRAALATADGTESPPVQPLLLDSISLARLGEPAGVGAYPPQALAAQVSRPFQAIDPRDALVCPSREPCRVAGDGVYVQVWEARQQGGELEVVVTRIFNVQELYVMAASATHRLRLRPEGAGWRLVRRDRIPD